MRCVVSCGSTSFPWLVFFCTLQALKLTVVLFKLALLFTLTVIFVVAVVGLFTLTVACFNIYCCSQYYLHLLLHSAGLQTHLCTLHTCIVLNTYNILHSSHLPLHCSHLPLHCSRLLLHCSHLLLHFAGFTHQNGAPQVALTFVCNALGQLTGQVQAFLLTHCV